MSYLRPFDTRRRFYKHIPEVNRRLPVFTNHSIILCYEYTGLIGTTDSVVKQIINMSHVTYTRAIRNVTFVYFWQTNVGAGERSRMRGSVT
jgi:hypothetical protein